MYSLVCSVITVIYSFQRQKKNAQARNRTGGPTMATLDFTTKPLALPVETFDILTSGF